MSQGTTPWGPTPAGPTPAGTTPESERDTEFQEHEKILSPDFLSVAQITDLLTEDVDGVQEKLRIFLNFKNVETCLMDAILLDYYVSGFLWARRMDFSVIQYSKFMTLLAMLLWNLKTLHMSLEDSIKWLGEVMAEIGPNHSRKSEEWNIFDVKQANAIIDYIKISLFQHYKLYEFMFYSAREEIVIGTEHFLGCPDIMPKVNCIRFSNPHLKVDIFKSKCFQRKITWIFQDQKPLKKKRFRVDVIAAFKSKGLTR
ncbi:ciliary-associated calcium-binding coiled-coil protein 1 isoform X2 [Cebus imitator]|uniref:ciliary-associated calcium-binding coiled-coil protein 1 isoform X2 n=1 Tax=Cebus imitator TaxID=2715852 RepID=UPI00189BAEAA|nr:ciliary-associated calcium-binding coiled-coil protein 1 isoform X2 [Cebus imitator]